MKRTVPVVFDGEVLRPDEPLDLELNGYYRVTIEEPARKDETRAPGGLDDILELAQDLDLPEDLAAQIDHYLYGTPKR